MCHCFSLSAAPPSPRTLPAAEGPSSGRYERDRDTEEDAAELAALSQTGPWIDVHAHPGRGFLQGLPEGNGLRATLGSDDVPRALEELRAGEVTLCSFSTVGDLCVLGISGQGIRTVRDFKPGEAWADHERQLDALLGRCRGGQLRLVRESADLRPRADGGAPGMLLSCEGADFLEGRVERVALVHARGVRSITLVHYRVNELGDIQTEPPHHGGLSDFGREVVVEMNRLGMIVDLAHATWEVTRDVLESSSQPVMISHSHLVRGQDAHPRLLSEEHALAVARSGGVVGAWPAGVALTSFQDFVDEILRLVDLLGPEHVAIGTDMDANYRPVMTSHRQFPSLALQLREGGLGRSETALVLGGSFARLFEIVERGALDA